MNIEQKREQINLAFEWKRIDIIKNFIMKDDRDWKVKDFYLFMGSGKKTPKIAGA
jgi:hypothetical protein